MKRVKEALKDTTNLSTADAASLKKAVEDALAALKDSTYQRELATIAVDSFATIDEADYTTNSYAAFKAAKEALDTLIAADGTKPAAFKTATADYTTAKTALVNVAALKAQIAHESNYVEANYTADSWKVFAARSITPRPCWRTRTPPEAQISGALTTLKSATAALVKAGDTGKPDDGDKPSAGKPNDKGNGLSKTAPASPSSALPCCCSQPPASSR